MDVTALVQSAFMLCLGIFFSAVAIDRQTLVTSLLASVIWLVEGVVNWLFAPASNVGQAMSYIFWIISMVFIGLFFGQLFGLHFEKKNRRFEMGI